MTEMNTALKDRVLDHDDDLRDMLLPLLRRADRRQLWLLFLDEDGRLAEPIMPLADYPENPLARTMADDLGEVTEAELVMHRAGALCELTGNRSIVLVWERSGPPVVRDEDRAWPRAMAEQALAQGVSLRAQFVLHDLGLRQLRMDDYV